MASPTLRSVLKGLRWPEKVVIGGVAASLVYTSLLLRRSHTAPARYEAEWTDLAYEAKLADGLTTGGQMATSIRREVQAHEGGRAGRVPPPRAGSEAEAFKGRTIPPSGGGRDIITGMSTAPPAAPETTGAGDGPGARSDAT
jgi:hypothetical protein